MSPKRKSKRTPRNSRGANGAPTAVTKARRTPGEFERAGRAAEFIFSRTALRPKIALVLGSGLGALADEFSSATKIPYVKIPHFPQSTAIGHADKLVIGRVGAIPVAGMQGRVHLYEGYSVKEVAFPVRVFARMGVKAVILTNAAGGIKREFVQGRLVVISDHINLTGTTPLLGSAQFIDMTQTYSPRLREIFLQAARTIDIVLHEGVYAGLLGPQYETPAEVRMLQKLGADAIGMSTVLEVIQARAIGLEVAAFSCLTIHAPHSPTGSAAEITRSTPSAAKFPEFDNGCRVRQIAIRRCRNQYLHRNSR